jgi:mono/diheme cytochrome c family protein
VLATAALLLLALSGCGSSSTQNGQRARIAVALRKLEREYIADQKKAARKLARESPEGETLAAATIVYAPPPRGIGQAEWNAAIKHDARLQKLFNGVGPATGRLEIEVPTPSGVATGGGHALAEYEAGKRAVLESGCLACHRIGSTGNAGPGPDLTEIAGRLPRQAIARTLVAPSRPMPSYRDLPPARFKAIVAFLSELK